MEMIYGGRPIAETILLVLLLAQLVLLWGFMMYKMGAREEK
jgi:hypothetical protein